MKALKDEFFNKAFYRWLSAVLAECAPRIDRKQFYNFCIKNLSQLELKQRLTHTTLACRQFFPSDYRKSLKILYQLAERIENNSFSYMFMPDFVSTYGNSHYDISMQALKDFTQYSSSEFAVRTFLKQDFEKTIKLMMDWTQDNNVHVRRLASEGTRPRLPWAPKLDVLTKHPKKTYPILNLLKQDLEKYVMKSVANHINDISKDNADFIVGKISRWNLNHPSTGWIVKHGIRTLIKQGNYTALSMIGVQPKPAVSVMRLSLNKKTFKLGEDMVFNAKIQSTKNTDQKLCVDYRVYYMKSSGKQNGKVFKLKNINLKAGQTVNLKKHHRFRDFTTRKHYPGMHGLELVINGNPVKKLNFELNIN